MHIAYKIPANLAWKKSRRKMYLSERQKKRTDYALYTKGAEKWMVKSINAFMRPARAICLDFLPISLILSFVDFNVCTIHTFIHMLQNRSILNLSYKKINSVAIVAERLHYIRIKYHFQCNLNYFKLLRRVFIEFPFLWYAFLSIFFSSNLFVF